MARKLNWEQENRIKKSKKPLEPKKISGVSEPDAVKNKVKRNRITLKTANIADGASVQCRRCKKWMRYGEYKVHSCQRCEKCGKYVDTKKVKFHKCRQKDLIKWKIKQRRSN